MFLSWQGCIVVYRGKYKFWLNNFGFCLDWIDYADNHGGMKTKNPDHHPGKSYNVRIRGRQFLTFHAANVQIWATGHFLSDLWNTIAIIIINSAFIRKDLICLFGLTIVQTSSFPRPIVKQLLEFPKPGKFSKNYLGFRLALYFYF